MRTKHSLPSPAGARRSGLSVRMGAALFGLATAGLGAHCDSSDPSEQEADPVDESTQEHPANHLANETSPYLLQHAHNPVDWYPWGEEAFEKARKEGKPIFLSIGYAACHWCHVMERESFEVKAVADVMNELFVNIKVDREERPDIDELYMKGVQALTGGGGWPMSVWLLPDGRPFYGGTYFPPEDRGGRAGFVRVCRRMAELFHDDHDRVVEAAAGLTKEIQRLVAVPPGVAGEFDGETMLRACDQILESFDPVHGGFGTKPKFPHPMDLSFLLRLTQHGPDEGIPKEKAIEAIEFTLTKMARGGMYDLLGGGFHRYSTDEMWLIPHFEKMLYDNALLAGTYLDAWLITGNLEHRRIVVEILDYVLREMTSPEGGFYSTQDADSEGEEGKFFAWDRAEVAAVLGGEMGARFADFHGVTEEGNFEHGKSALWRPFTHAGFAEDRGLELSKWTADWAQARARMLDDRESRIKPGRDEKILVDWNGLMIGTMARAGFHLKEPRYLQAAHAAAAFVRRTMFPEGEMVRVYKDGKAHLMANLGDYANLIGGLLDLFEADFDPAHLAWAKELAGQSLTRFWDKDQGGFFFTANDAQALIARSKEAYDGATPSAPSVQAANLLRLSELLGEPRWRESAEKTLKLYGRLIQQHPRALTRMVQAVHFQLSRPREVVLAGHTREELEPMLEVLRSRLNSTCVVLVRTDENAEELEAVCALVRGKTPGDDGPRAYVCRDFVCEAPIADPALLRRALSGDSP